jgi:hypothetical protein
MLRRNFVKAMTIAAGSFLLIDDIPFAASESPEDTTRPGTAPVTYHFHGHPRSGCSTRPELAAMLGKGFSVIPPA